MKIENNPINPLLPNKSDGALPVKNSSRGTESAGAAGSKDRAELSERARLLAKARAALETAEDANQGKVNDLKERIQNGDYHIPFDDLARRLMIRLGLKPRE